MTAQPHMRIVKGAPSDMEVAALVAGLVAAAAPDEDAVQHPHGWDDRSRSLRTPVTPGPSMWRWSLR